MLLEKPPLCSPRPQRNEKTARQTYNIVSDTVIGANLRLRDNLMLGFAVLICAAIGAVLRVLVIEETMAGPLVGGGIGMVAGLFLSGIFLLTYRGVQHARGTHD